MNCSNIKSAMLGILTASTQRIGNIEPSLKFARWVIVVGFVTKMLSWSRVLPSKVTPNSCNWNNSENSNLWHCTKWDKTVNFEDSITEEVQQYVRFGRHAWHVVPSCDFTHRLYIHVTVRRYWFLYNNQPDALIIQIYSVIKLYMFRATSLFIIRSFLLHIRHW